MGYIDPINLIKDPCDQCSTPDTKSSRSYLSEIAETQRMDESINSALSHNSSPTVGGRESPRKKRNRLKVL